MCFTIYFLVFFEREIVYMIALKLLEPKTCELKVKGDVFDLFVAIGTLGSSLSMILRASAKLDWVTSIYKY